jgi:hypothetical protein
MDGGGAAVGVCGMTDAEPCGTVVVVVALAAGFSAVGVTTAVPFAGATATVIAGGAAAVGGGVVVMAEAAGGNGVAGAVAGADGVTGG